MQSLSIKNIKESEEKHSYSKNIFLLRLVFFLSILLWLIGLGFHSIFYKSESAAVISPFLKLCYSHVCHQLDSKTFSINGYKLFVCARCTGIYFGAFFASFLSLFIKLKNEHNINYLVYFSLPLIFDVIFTTFNLYSYSKLLAMSTGILFGSIIFIYILETIENSIYRTAENKNVKK